jgi:hypothetical protein
MVKERAIELTTCPDFIASKGWLDKFKIRYNLDIAKGEGSCSRDFKRRTDDGITDSEEEPPE